ncbi:MAG: hypothetical protein AAF216_08370 [Pseudomonadota bacterium]
MYRAGAESDRYVTHLYGYVFYKAGEVAFLASEAEIDAEDIDAASAIREALTLLSKACPTALRPDVLDADQFALTVAASQVIMAVEN